MEFFSEELPRVEMIDVVKLSFQYCREKLSPTEVSLCAISILAGEAQKKFAVFYKDEVPYFQAGLNHLAAHVWLGNQVAECYVISEAEAHADNKSSRMSLDYSIYEHMDSVDGQRREKLYRIESLIEQLSGSQPANRQAIENAVAWDSLAILAADRRQAEQTFRAEAASIDKAIALLRYGPTSSSGGEPALSRTNNKEVAH